MLVPAGDEPSCAQSLAKRNGVPLYRQIRPLPLRFGEENEKGLVFDSKEMRLNVVTVGENGVTEDDILRIATARASSASVLQLVLRSRRWGTAPRVRRALIRNPRLPLATALRLVGLLNRREIEEIARDPHLPPRLSQALRRRLRPLI